MCPGSVTDFFFFMCLGSVTDFFFVCVYKKKKKKKKKEKYSLHFLTIGQEIRNITFSF